MSERPLVVDHHAFERQDCREVGRLKCKYFAQNVIATSSCLLSFHLSYDCLLLSYPKMEEPQPLWRSKSVRSTISSSERRDSVLEEAEHLPTVKVGKPTLLGLRIAKDDIGLRPSFANVSPSSLRLHSARNTWPQGLRESKPGSYAFEQVPTLTKTPWERNRALRSTPRSSGSTSRSSVSTRTLSRLPREILHCVLDHLYALHVDTSQLDVVSLRHDLRTLSITNKQWHRVAREHLYREIWLPSSPVTNPTRGHLAHVIQRSTSSLRLLLRTLREAPGLAQLVKRICIPTSVMADLDYEMYMETGHGRGASLSSRLADVCELIRRCPNARALSGYYPMACDRSLELVNALASRSQLGEHVWNLPRCPEDGHALVRSSAFIGHHVQWRQLQTLIMWKDGSYADCLAPGTITAVLQRLPSLQRLMLKGLSRSEFHNGTLLMLPALKALRLEDMAGISDHGLQQLVHSRLALSLEKLSVIGLEITSLRTIQALLGEFPRLKRFCLIQETSPELQEVFSFAGSSFSLEAPGVEYLHWNTLLLGNATAILANAIAAGKFPSLRQVKVPCDTDGAVQRLCRPIAQRRLTQSEIGLHLLETRSAGLEYRKTAQFMETEAQLRAKRARKDSVFSVTVEDEDGVEQFQWAGSYLGGIASKIEYCLEPDIEGQHLSYARIEDLARPARCRGGYEQTVGVDVLFA